MFDIGWQVAGRVFIGEVKSLRATNQDQQIRLGIGQVLDRSARGGLPDLDPARRKHHP